MPESKSTAEKNTPEKEKDDSLMHTMKEGKSSSSFFTTKLFVFIVIAALLGVGSGYILAQNGGKTGITSLDRATNAAKIPKGEIFGSDDTEHYRDTAEGEIKEGGVGDEGSHSLIRPGGESQTVCLTSSLVDLDMLDGRKVKVWGETNTPEACGWLMDVGRVQVLN